MTGKQQPDDMMPDSFSKFMRPSAERDELIRQLTTPINQPKKLPSEKLYTQCGACKGTGNQWDVDIKNIERAARQIRVDCRLCEGKGYFESGLHTGQVDRLMEFKEASEHSKVNQARIDALLRHIHRTQEELDELEANPEYDDTGHQTEAYLMEYDLAIATYAGLRERIGDLYVAQSTEDSNENR